MAPDMEGGFRELAARAFPALRGSEVLLLNFDGEDSDFVRFNRNAIRQCGHVRQQRLRLTLIDGARQAAAALDLSGEADQDAILLHRSLDALREQLSLLPADPFVHYATGVHGSVKRADHTLPSAAEATEAIATAARGLDLVGLWASGETASGFASSLGQINWHTSRSFNFDWSLYDHGDKAVKQSYAGLHWRPAQFEARIGQARETLRLLARPPRRIDPGRYRVFLTPVALFEIMTLLGGGGFGLKSHRTAQTPLLRMVREGAALDPRVSLSEHHAGGLTPAFTRTGFIKPARVELIRSGVYADCLADARSAREYGMPVNCDSEQPQSLELGPGELPAAAILDALDTGLLISNLWYCNYSDRSHCRITGMTRFATLWVEDGRAVAPLEVMRFDDTLYNMLGAGLIALTRDQEQIFDCATYGGRSLASARLPGVLVEGFTLTL